MPYMLNVEPVGQRQDRGAEAGREANAQMVRFGEGRAARGLLVASNSLASTEQGVRVPVRDAG